MNIDVPVSTRKFLSVPLKKETRRLRARQRHAQIELARKEHLWQLQLYKHHLPKRRVDTLRRITNAKAWFKIICAAKFALKANALVVANRRLVMARRQSVSAANLLGSSWKKSYSHRKAIQHRRSIEILRERAWVARLNVRSRMRKRESTIIKRFLIEADKVGRFAYVCRAFRYKILCLQRRLRSFFVVHKVRLEHMMRFFRKYEGAVLNRLNREQKERIRLEEEATSADLKARAAEARNADQVTKSRQNQASKTAIGRSIAQIMKW